MLPYQKVKLVLLGDSYVGKTSFLERVTNSNYITNPSLTTSMKFINFRNNYISTPINFQLWDTPGASWHRNTSLHFIKATDAVIVIHDATQPLDTYMNEWTTLIRQYNKECPIFLLHTKSDLISPQEHIISNSMEYIDIGYVNIHEYLDYNELFNDIYTQIKLHRGF